MLEGGLRWTRLSLVGAFFGAVVVTGVPVGAAAPVASLTASGWKIRDAVSPRGLDGSFAADACSGQSFCMAVGPLGSLAVAAVGNGYHWAVHVLPEPAHVFGAMPSSVSCPSPTECMVVGSFATSPFTFSAPAAWIWNGRTFALHRLAMRPGAEGGVADGVSCASATWCMAVGTSVFAFGGDKPIVDVWDGRTWHPVASPRLSAGLSTVSCRAFGCFALSTTGAGSPFPVYDWDGKQWSVTDLPIPTGERVESRGPLTCPTSSFCMAVATTLSTTGSGALVETWSGSHWTHHPGPVFKESDFANLAAVSCTGANSCIVVGYEVLGDPAVAATWNGQAWRVTKVPIPEGSTVANLYSVSCLRPSRCIAVGNAYAGSEHSSSLTLAEVWDGASWRVQPSPTPIVPLPAELTNASCTGTTTCTATGVITTGLEFQPFSESWSGSAWHVHAMTPGDVVTSVNCVADRFCVAVGVAAGFKALVDMWNGRVWTAAKLPPGVGTNFLESVSCASETACLAVGDTGPQSGLAYRWNGHSWKPLAFPRLGPVSLNGVSCASATSCEVVGSDGPDGGANHALAAGWNGKAWVVQSLPKTGDASLSSVSCPSPTTCYAVGLLEEPVNSQFLAEGYKDGAWSQESINTPAETSGYLRSVSCSADSSCVAVGSELDDVGAGSPSVVESWTGAKWVAEPSPEKSAGFGSVTCVATGACLVVGSTAVGTPFAATEGSA